MSVNSCGHMASPVQLELDLFRLNKLIKFLHLPTRCWWWYGGGVLRHARLFTLTSRVTVGLIVNSYEQALLKFLEDLHSLSPSFF